MKIALVGATGHAGSRILRELADRGHDISAIVRQPDRVPSLPGVTAKKADVLDRDALPAAVQGHDLMISSLLFTHGDPAILIDTARHSGVARYIVVGGAGSLQIDSGQTLLEAGFVPAPYVEESRAAARFLERLRETEDLDWTFISPSAEFFEGERTGRFRIGGDRLLRDEQGRSSISYEDFAVALADEIEQPRHRRGRFTVGY